MEQLPLKLERSDKFTICPPKHEMVQWSDRTCTIYEHSSCIVCCGFSPCINIPDFLRNGKSVLMVPQRCNGPKTLEEFSELFQRHKIGGCEQIRTRNSTEDCQRRIDSQLTAINESIRSIQSQLITIQTGLRNQNGILNPGMDRLEQHMETMASIHLEFPSDNSPTKNTIHSGEEWKRRENNLREMARLFAKPSIPDSVQKGGSLHSLQCTDEFFCDRCCTLHDGISKLCCPRRFEEWDVANSEIQREEREWQSNERDCFHE